ncbi:class II aldolase/adducin family protein [Trinickia mobilis]|uniref:class II aldolase/adducin family protein n=1 Tax=Trinickia mobilis TaxID=2816356 RepID=UPI001A8E8FFA|nr:class II aldolase/adducin family protein [Trinickia mobilis]
MNSDITYTSFELPAGQRADSDAMTEAERQVRVDLAAAYRLCALYGWDDLIYTHISARVPGPDHYFLVNPLGLAFDEITASSLVKIDLEGNVIGASVHRPNAAGFVIHGGIHSAREDAGSIMHLHTDAGMALSMLQTGLLPLSQHAMRFHGRVGYHDYQGIALSTKERDELIADLGTHAALILRNHGTLTVGRTVGQAFVEMFFLEKAAHSQLLALSTGQPLTMPDHAVIELTAAQWAGDLTNPNQREWPSLLRKLDRLDPSYRD